MFTSTVNMIPYIGNCHLILERKNLHVFLFNKNNVRVVVTSRNNPYDAYKIYFIIVPTENSLYRSSLSFVK